MPPVTISRHEEVKVAPTGSLTPFTPALNGPRQVPKEASVPLSRTTLDSLTHPQVKGEEDYHPDQAACRNRKSILNRLQIHDYLPELWRYDAGSSLRHIAD
jgi:hypothetical protein